VRRLKSCKVLTYYQSPQQSKILVISQDQIEQINFQDRTDPENRINLNTKLPVKEFTEQKILTFAKFISVGDRPGYLVTINLECLL